jgi:hypothetical protein
MTKPKTLQEKAMLAMREAVRKVVERHKQSGRPLSIWENGKVKKVFVK